MSKADEAKVLNLLRDFGHKTSARSTLNGHWEEVAALILPSYVNTFHYGATNTPGEKKTREQVDGTGMLALSRFAAICDSLLTPRNMMWHMLEPDADYLMKDRAVRLWFQDTTRKLFKLRYAPTANFSAQNQAVFTSLGAFGTGVLFIDKFYDNQRKTQGIRYKAVPMGEIYLGENHQGLYDQFIRILKYDARQMDQIEAWKGKLPEKVMQALEKNDPTKFTILHCVGPRTDYDADRIDSKGMPFYSIYVLMEGKCLLSEGGYNSFPVAASRYQQAPGEQDGRGPAMDVLPSLKTLNAQKKVFLKQGHRAADPVLLTQDDGLMNLSLRPGALNKGGWSADGHPLVGVLPTGNIQVTELMMGEEKNLIEDALLVSLFKVIFENPQMTATQVVEVVNQKGILIAPTVGRQQSEYLGPTIDREVDLGSQMGLFEPMPPALREARGGYQTRYTSPLAKAMRAGEAAGFMRTVEAVKEIVNITGDPSLLDPFDFDVAIPEIADIQSVPAHWMSSDEKIQQIRAARAEAAKQQQEIQAAPAAAAMVKANAAAAAAGVTPAARTLAPPRQGYTPGVP